jgi:hypothetical protein
LPSFALHASNNFQLEWWFAGKGFIDSDEWYTNYKKNEIPRKVENPDTGDTEDSLRSSDLCPNKKKKTLSRRNCPKPPNCEKIKERWGKAKLCINRVPLPDRRTFYVAAMKCIPEWENCDKCMCGAQRQEGQRKSSRSICRFTGEGIDDDRVSVRCRKDRLKKIKFEGMKFKSKAFKIDRRRAPARPDFELDGLNPAQGAIGTFSPSPSSTEINHMGTLFDSETTSASNSTSISSESPAFDVLFRRTQRVDTEENVVSSGVRSGRYQSSIIGVLLAYIMMGVAL